VNTIPKLTAARILEILEDHNALVIGHFILTSGLHSNLYLNKDAICPDTIQTEQFCQMMAQPFVSHCIEVVVAPEKGGIILSQWIAHHLTLLTGKSVLAVYAEKSTALSGGKKFLFSRGYDKLIVGKRVLVAEDILTTGWSALSVTESVREVGGEVIGVTVICNRGNVTVGDLGNVPILHSLLTSSDFVGKYEPKIWPPAECELCHQNIPTSDALGKTKGKVA